MEATLVVTSKDEGRIQELAVLAEIIRRFDVDVSIDRSGIGMSLFNACQRRGIKVRRVNGGTDGIHNHTG